METLQRTIPDLYQYHTESEENLRFLNTLERHYMVTLLETRFHVYWHEFAFWLINWQQIWLEILFIKIMFSRIWQLGQILVWFWKLFLLLWTACKLYGRCLATITPTSTWSHWWSMLLGSCVNVWTKQLMSIKYSSTLRIFKIFKYKKKKKCFWLHLQCADSLTETKKYPCVCCMMLRRFWISGTYHTLNCVLK